MKKNLKAAGATVEEFLQLLESQNGVCAICGEPCKTGRRLAIDHSHKNKNRRGLLCHNCNRGLGMFDDDIVRLRRAIQYLESTKSYAPPKGDVRVPILAVEG